MHEEVNDHQYDCRHTKNPRQQILTHVILLGYVTGAPARELNGSR